MNPYKDALNVRKAHVQVPCNFVNKIMDYAVVKIGGKQFKVSQDDTLEVEKLSNSEKKVEFEEVLLASLDGRIRVGTPTVKGAKVTATVLENKKGEKIRVSKFKAKSRYRRTAGFRPHLTVLKIDKIEF